MAVYLDVIWALNFLFDSLLLYLTAIILKRDYKFWRIFVGGLIGSVIIILAFTPLNAYSGHPLTKLLLSIVMVLVTFGYKRFRYFLQGLMTFYLTTFLIGGALIGAHYFIQFDMTLSSSVLIGSVKGFGDPISWLFVLLGFPIAWHFSKRNFEQLEVTKIQYDQLISVFVTLGGTQYQFKGLIDSGNQLYDPISKMPVMFISIKNKLESFPETICQMAKDPQGFILGENNISSEWESRMRVIPYSVVGQEHQLIIGLKPDKLVFDKDDEQLVVDKGLISFTLQQLSSDDAFDCIVHPKMLTTRKRMSSSENVKGSSSELAL